MTPAQRAGLLRLIEKQVDRHTVAEVLEVVSEVCDAKEEHVRSAWQDWRRARAYHRASCLIMGCASKVAEELSEWHL